MRMLKRGTTLVVVLMAVASCGDLLKKKNPDAGATATTTDPVNGTPVPVPALLALNQGDIARYPDETAVPAPTKFAFQRGFNVRESIPNGKIVMGLGKGTIATQIAKRPPYTLITFDNPGAPGATMMGWVHQDAFSLTMPDAGTITCAAGDTALFSDVPTCGRVCTKDADCTAGNACTGTSNRLAAGKAGEAVKVCATAVIHDAGAPTPPTPAPVDAGKPAVVDAGPPTPPAAVDAGKPNTADPPAGTDEVNALPGKTCPGSFLYATKTGHCHRPCKNAAGANQCDLAKHFCSSCDGKQMCTNSRGVCK